MPSARPITAATLGSSPCAPEEALPRITPSLPLSILIVNTNSRDLLLGCLGSVRDTVEIPYEIIVVDNGSTDGSVEALEHARDVMLIANRFNNWFTGATNQAILVSRGEFLLCLNPDTVLHAGAVDRLVAFLRENPRVAVVGPRLLNGDGTLQPSCRNFLTNRRLVLQHLLPWRRMPNSWRRHAVLEYWDHDSPCGVDWVIGACILVRRSAVEQIGLKDEGYPIFHEETDWCYRFRQAGWETWFLSDALVTHFGSQTVSKLWGRGLVLQFYKGKHRFIRKHYGRNALLAHRLLLSGLLLARLVRANLARLMGRPYAEIDVVQRALALQMGRGGGCE
ncbi:glycosyltransferase family 2 protein [Candidatus Fermentibacteria bacterium]|nr:glycosyltransferase family 2 protein [Candidatus Fermentibacteria bacterium]